MISPRSYPVTQYVAMADVSDRPTAPSAYTMYAYGDTLEELERDKAAAMERYGLDNAEWRTVST